MRAVVQRVLSSDVTIEGKKVAEIQKGMMILVAVEDTDTEEDISWLSDKIIRLRIFDDEEGVMNLSVKDISADILIVSQFTLYASTRKGNRPSYLRASKPDFSKPMYEKFVKAMEERLGRKIPCGVFGADMQVALVNDGPVTIIIDTKYKE